MVRGFLRFFFFLVSLFSLFGCPGFLSFVSAMVRGREIMSMACVRALCYMSASLVCSFVWRKGRVLFFFSNSTLSRLPTKSQGSRPVPRHVSTELTFCCPPRQQSSFLFLCKTHPQYPSRIVLIVGNTARTIPSPGLRVESGVRLLAVGGRRGFRLAHIAAAHEVGDLVLSLVFLFGLLALLMADPEHDPRHDGRCC